MEQVRELTKAEVMLLIRERIAQAWTSSGHTTDPPPFGEDDNLFDVGVVDSLTMVELVVYIETLSGDEPIDLLTVDPELFFTLNGMWEVVQDRQGTGRPGE